MQRIDQAASLLKETLKARRRAMGAGNRARSRTLNTRRAVWLYPFQYERKYFKYIRSIVKTFSRMASEELRNNLDNWVNENRIDSFRTDTFIDEWGAFIEDLRIQQNALFGDDRGKGNVIAFLGDLGNDINEFNQAQYQKFMKIAIGEAFAIDEPWVASTIDTWSQTNFELIKTLTDDYIKQLNTIVTNSVQTGALTKDIMKDFRKMDKNMSVNRARLLARDQVGKLNGILTKNRQENAGIDMYTWMTAADERVRASHKKINGKVCRWDNNNVYKNPGENLSDQRWKKRPQDWPHTIPGNEIQCRCQAIPYFDDLIAEIDKEIAEEEKLAA